MGQNVTLINETTLSIMDNDIIDYFVVVFKDLNDNYKMYFSWYDYDENVLKIEGLSSDVGIPIATNYNEEGYYTSEYGEIDSVINLQDLIVTYSEIEKVYNSDEINSILESYCQDYIKLKDKENVKKLNLKYVEK